MKYALLVSTLFVTLVSSAQNNLQEYALKRSLKQDGLHFVFTVMESDARGVRNYNTTKFYFWLKAQKVLATQGASSGQLLHGEFEAFYLDKQLARKGNFSKGLKNGRWNYWREDGTLEKSEHWSNGTLRGTQRYYDASGNVERTTHLHRNRSKSICKDSIVFQKSLHRQVILLKDSVGQTTEIQRFKNGRLHGVRNSYEDGKLISRERYKYGELVVNEKDAKTESANESDATKMPLSLKDRWNKWFKKENRPEKEQKDKTDAPKSKKEKPSKKGKSE